MRNCSVAAGHDHSAHDRQRDPRVTAITTSAKVAHNFPRSFFETTRKRCNPNDAHSMFEQAAGELRAKLLGDRGAWLRCPRVTARPPPDKFRMQFPQDTNRCTLKNRRISTIRFQHLKYTQGNCMRNCWATRRVKLAARTARGRAAAHGHIKQPGPTSSPAHINRQRGARNTRRAATPPAQHNETRPRPVSRPRPRHSVSATPRSSGAASDQAVMSTWSSTAARPASRRATGTRNGEQDT